jgi:hypothetical protein
LKQRHTNGKNRDPFGTCGEIESLPAGPVPFFPACQKIRKAPSKIHEALAQLETADQTSGAFMANISECPEFLKAENFENQKTS